MSPMTERPRDDYWLSLEHLARDPELCARIRDEFPGYDPAALAEMPRRRFLRLMGGAMALAGLTLSGCRRYPAERLAPHARRPEERVPGALERYATGFEIDGATTGLLVTTHDGRPIKIEGNPLHPDSLGATDGITQATVLDLYDPDRSRWPVEMTAAGERRRRGWDQFDHFAGAHFRALRALGGGGLAFLCGRSTSPTSLAMRARLREVFPRCRWYEHEPFDAAARIEGSRLAFGRALRPIYRLHRAAVIAAIDADLFGSHPAKLRHASEWAAARKPEAGRMNRLWSIESELSITGSVADHRLAQRPGRIEAIVQELARRLAVAGVTDAVPLDDRETRFVDRLAADLRVAGAASLITVGDAAAPRVHELAHRINAALGALGQTVEFVEEPAREAGTIAELAREIESRSVETLVILDGNPGFDAPADLGLAAHIGRVPTTIRLGLYDDETSALCTWHVPRAHFLESWSDGRAWDGAVSIGQPLILPLHDGRTDAELLAGLAGDATRSGYDLVRRTARDVIPHEEGDAAFERAWRRALHDGVVERTAWPRVEPELVGAARSTASEVAVAEGATGRLDVVFRRDPRLHDGRFANNAWLQETPDPMTKVTWDNPALLSVRDAGRLGVRTGDVVRVSVDDRSVELPVFVLPGQPEGVLGVRLGSGRAAAGRIGNGVGFDAYPLRTSATLAFAGNATVESTGRRYDLASTQDHHVMDTFARQATEKRVGPRGESGKVVREVTPADFGGDAGLGDGEASVPRADGHDRARIFDPPSQFNEPHAWGMTIDMSSCIGCNACVTACQAENNIPVVGKEEVARNREMHWIRIDRYFKGDPESDESPDVVHQPVMCVHCENAPCEQVCPVAATVHDTEGLNTMVYNRCIGTRYCANNCPYKVRRFNYFDYHSKEPGEPARPWAGMPDSQQLISVDEVKRMVFNPDVTVRMRGVMEKCTYCVQRIQRARIDRRRRGEEIRDGDIVTACQQVCPTQAIVFGDIGDPDSRVRALQESPRAYPVLEELGVRPRTLHLAKARNPAKVDFEP